MRVVNICVNDWANYSHDNAAALRSVGVHAVSVKSKLHQYQYVDQGEVRSDSQIKSLINASDIVQLMHSDSRYLQYARQRRKKIFVYHTGSNYRIDPVKMNGMFNPHVEAALTDQTEFIGLGMKNEQYIATAVDMARYKCFSHQVNKPISIAHYPSNPTVKGTEEIIAMMTKLDQKKFAFEFSTDLVNNKAQIERLAKCDIYIELFKPVLNGKPYGCYGVTAFEAAACGKVVVTQNLRPQVYARVYGDCPFVITNDEDSFLKEMNRLINTPSLEISTIQTETYNWVKEKHSYEATGLRLKKLLGIK